MDKKKELEPMNMMELEGILGDRIRIALKEDLTQEERQTENEQSALITDLAKQYINGADFILRTEKLLAQTKSLKNSCAVELIRGKK